MTRLRRRPQGMTVTQPILIPETLTPPKASSTVQAICTSFAKPYDKAIPTFELWAFDRNLITPLTETFVVGQATSITSSLITNKDLFIETPVSILPYQTTQFGHFIGDCIGQLIFYAHRADLRGHRPLLTIYPSLMWLHLLSEICPPDSLYISEPSSTVGSNLHLNSGSLLLPRFSVLQNLHFGSYFISNYLAAYQQSRASRINIPAKVFFTSNTTTRISNLYNVTSFLRSIGFTIVTPSTFTDLAELLSILSTCSILVSEQGSIHQNVLVSRSKPYYVLSSVSSKHQTNYEASCGGIYSTYHAHLINFIYCQDSLDDRNLHPYSRPITVDVEELRSLFS